MFFNQKISDTTKQHSQAAAGRRSAPKLPKRTLLSAARGAFVFDAHLHLSSAALLRSDVCWSVCASGIASISSPPCQSFDFPPVRLVIETGPEPGGVFRFCVYANPERLETCLRACAVVDPPAAGRRPRRRGRTRRRRWGVVGLLQPSVCARSCRHGPRRSEFPHC